ncbi:MAG: amino acid ABC transporter substrate-binding protein [Candidatus Lambdaproteobacteria bacterium]|nr:amino acid ABC transporter substrate-binding protein [Candidatus Lambdaproteobacteria bacterium]
MAATPALTDAGARAGTLETVKARGALLCGVAESLPGFAYLDAQGRMQGFDVDFCQALAAAIGVTLKPVPLSAKERFTALQAGTVDVLYRVTTWTLNRDTQLGLNFGGVNYYDGQGFLVRRASGLRSARELGGASICLNTGTSTELNLADWFRLHRLAYKPVLFEKSEAARAAYEAGRCDAYTTDASALAAQRSVMQRPGEHVILPEIISREPLGPLTRHGDDRWGDVVRWVLNALVIAEEKGVTQANAAEAARSSRDPEVQRMLGTTGSSGAELGLPPDWALRAIRAVGNYGEIFERHLGRSTPLELERGLNQLWHKGGILFAPPIR